MSTPPSLSASQPRPGCWFFTLPVGLVMIIVAAYGVLFVLGARGRPADGDTMRLRYAACAAALPIVQGRVEAMGLGDPRFDTTLDGFELTTRLPSEADRAARIPVVLALTGDLQVLDAETGALLVDRSHVTGSLVRLDIVANPSSVVFLDEAGAKVIADFRAAAPLGAIAVAMDGERVWTHKNEHPLDPTRLDVLTTKTTLHEGTAQVAEWVVLLDAPALPCPVQLVSSETVEVTEVP